METFLRLFPRAQVLLFVFMLIAVCVFTMSSPRYATALGNQADLMCLPYVMPVCKCGFDLNDGTCKPGPNRFLCDCWDNTQGFITFGKCVATQKCQALGTSDGTFDVGQEILDEVLKQGIQQLVSSLMQSGQPAPGSSNSQSYGSSGPPPGSGGCLSEYFQTSDITQLTNPCAQYVPDVSGGIDTGGDGECDFVSSILGMCGGTVTPTPSTPGSTPSPTTTKPAQTLRTIFQPNLGGLTGPFGGLRGDILTRFQDATIIAGSRDEANNIEVAGFFGSQTFGNQNPQSLVARWCQSRPWANNFLSKIITPSFFDNLCKTRGYQVGVATSTSQVTLVQRSPTKPSTKPIATSTPKVQPKVDIWASPPSVLLGGRTSIFWNSEGVESCKETASDRNFNQQSLSGGAATVPITEATTFTITCLVSDGSSITGSVVVNLKI